ncbi:MAG: DUF2062 domain-containing protein [Pseudomonadota bacterium]
MPRRFFKKLAFKHTTFREQAVMRPFRHLLGDHRLWQIRRKTVVPAFALGAFFAFMPFPGHPLWASLAALWRRVNIPVAAITTLVSNPVTMPVMYYAAYRVGAYLLRMPPETIEFEMSLSWVTEVLVEIWQPMLLGCVLLGAIASLVAYAVLDLLWRRSVATYKLKKREQRHRRELKRKEHAR